MIEIVKKTCAQRYLSMYMNLDRILENKGAQMLA